ncbi:MAG: amidohydrolase family protein [Flavobacteriaceae bacterium]
MKTKLISLGMFFFAFFLQAQEYFPKNDGVKTPKHDRVTFVNAHIQVSPDKEIKSGYLIIENGKIVSVSSGSPKAVQGKVIDLKGNYIYPSFIDVFADFKVETKKSGNRNWFRTQYSPEKNGYYWNDHLNPEFSAFENLNYDQKMAKSLLNQGFGVISAQRKDGVARGTAVLVALNQKGADNLRVLDQQVSQQFGFSRANSSNQAYPNSPMGMIALIRQFNYDANWFMNHPELQDDFSIEAYNKTRSLPQFFDAGDKTKILRAAKISKEFNLNYIIKGGGDEYEYAEAIKSTGNRLVIPINFPEAYDMTNVFAQDYVSLGELKHWEQAASNPAVLAQSQIEFALTTADLKNVKDFRTNLIKAIGHGLSKEDALKSLTTVPASYLGKSDELGTLEEGKWANFVVSSGDIFETKTTLYQNWVQGEQNIIKPWSTDDLRGNYAINLGDKTYQMQLSGTPENLKASLKLDSVKISTKFELKNDWLSLVLPTESKDQFILLNGPVSKKGIQGGTAKLADGSQEIWTAEKTGSIESKTKGNDQKEETIENSPAVTYPNMAYGSSSMREQKTYLIKNATVWTNEDDGILQETDVLVKNGKIAKVGQNLKASGATVIDGTGKHLTTGIIDEHTHIGANGINEGGHNSSAEVSIEHVINAEDVNIYRNLAGGVTTAQILHGSANPIGGQSAIIKMKWGETPDNLIISNSPKFIKFALGENVKQSWNPVGSGRFPQTRTGVEQLYIDYFTRAQKYLDNKNNGVDQRVDLEMETLSEILSGDRFISCHSYVQSEITMMMRVADQFDFRMNTFTHILEGYKVADKMKEHGVGASTFSDWWAYKFEVNDAIPYNGAIMHDVGLTVAFNSDDAEMSRRLNQEAAKAMKYGGVSEEEAWKFVTLNPAKLLHIDDRLGSIKVGKDADLVLWDYHPMEARSKAQFTMVEGAIYFSVDQDKQMRASNEMEKNRIIGKMISAKNKGVKTIEPVKTIPTEYECETLEL